MVEGLEQFGRLRKKTWRHGKRPKKKDNGVFFAKSHGMFLQIKFNGIVSYWRGLEKKNLRVLKIVFKRWNLILDFEIKNYKI